VGHQYAGGWFDAMDRGSWGQIQKKFLLLVWPEPAVVTLVRRPLLEGIAEVTSHFLLLTLGKTLDPWIR
jgi:hypothetical protein